MSGEYGLLNRTHNNLIHCVCRELPIDIQLLQIFGSFFHKCKISFNPLVRLCTSICMGYTSAAANGRKINHFLKYDITHNNLSKIKFDIKHIFQSSNICINDIHIEVIRDLCGVRDRSLDCICSYNETCELLNYVCLM